MLFYLDVNWGGCWWGGYGGHENAHLISLAFDKLPMRRCKRAFFLCDMHSVIHKESLVLKLFRITSLVEGLSYLLILCVSLGLISRELVFSIGMGGHGGALFILYVVLSLIASHKQGWSVSVWLLVFLAALIPFCFCAC